LAWGGRAGGAGLFAGPGPRHRRIARECLEHVGIGHLASRSYVELSGGQKQRALIARALATEPDVLVLDEPTNGMDLVSEHSLLELVQTLHVEDRLTVILGSHLLANVANCARKIAIIESGKLDAGPREDMLTSEHLSRIYGLDVGVYELDGRSAIVIRNGHA